MTNQEALKEAIDNGSVQAWIENKPIQWSYRKSINWKDFVAATSYPPQFADHNVVWRITPIPREYWVCIRELDSHTVGTSNFYFSKEECLKFNGPIKEPWKIIKVREVL